MPPVDYSKLKNMLSFINEWRGNGNKDPYLTWYKAVSYFSGRRLTYKKDRLPVISGLAAEMRLLTGDKHLAGIWESDLLNGLSWGLYPGSDMSSVLRPLRYRAPSWPWASIDGKIEYFDPPKGILSHEMAVASFSGTHSSSFLDESMAPEVLEAQVHPSGLDTLGEVSTGHIVMNCISLPASVMPALGSSNFQIDHKVLFLMQQHQFPTVPRPFGFEFEFYRGIIDCVDDLGILTCVCIPIARRRVEFIDTVVALLVTPVPGATDIFRRIGIGWMHVEKATKLFTC
jgi:hypothetical protein